LLHEYDISRLCAEIVLEIICDTYQMSFSVYMQQALVEARFDIEEGNFSDALLEKIGGEDSSKKDNNSSPSSSYPASLAPDLMVSTISRYIQYRSRQ
jgi:hypothetical protein